VLTSHALGLVTIALIAVAWVAVQSAWKKVFPDRCSDPDALAGRIGCHGDGCSQACDRRPDTRAGTVQEDIS